MRLEGSLSAVTVDRRIGNPALAETNEIHERIESWCECAWLDRP